MADPVSTEELKAGLEALLGVTVDEMAEALAAGRIAKKREQARQLLAHARGRSAAKLATFDDAAAPILTARQQSEDAHRQIIDRLEAAAADLANDEDATLPTQAEVDAAILGWGE